MLLPNELNCSVTHHCWKPNRVELKGDELIPKVKNYSKAPSLEKFESKNGG